MLAKLRSRLTYANVMSTLAVFIALGGSSYAAFTINGSSIQNRSISGHKLRHNTLTGREIKESTLARVPRARDADRLEGMRAADFKIKCPSDTFPIADVCVERTPRAATPYGSAVLQCAFRSARLRAQAVGFRPTASSWRRWRLFSSRRAAS